MEKGNLLPGKNAKEWNELVNLRLRMQISHIRVSRSGFGCGWLLIITVSAVATGITSHTITPIVGT